MQPSAPRKFLLNSTYAAPSLWRGWANRWLAGMAGMVVVCTAHGQDATPTESLPRPSYHACVQASRGVTLALNDCIGVEYAFQDKRLNAAYLQLRTSLPEANRIALRDEEWVWIAHRDKSCAPDPEGGTASLLDANQCQLNETAARAAALEVRIR